MQSSCSPLDSLGWLGGASSLQEPFFCARVGGEAADAGAERNIRGGAASPSPIIAHDYGTITGLSASCRSIVISASLTSASPKRWVTRLSIGILRIRFSPCRKCLLLADHAPVISSCFLLITCGFSGTVPASP